MSIYDQEYGNIELIVIDDKSKDRTYGRLQSLFKTKFRERFHSTFLLLNEHNLGAHATINLGVKLSHGSLISIVNSDDLISKSRFSSMAKAISSSGTNLCFSLVDLIAGSDYSDPIPSYLKFLPIQQVDHLSRDITVGFALLRKNIAITTGNLLFSRSLYEAVGGFQPLRYCHDWDFVLQSLPYCEPICVPECLYHYRLHGANSFSSLEHLAAIETEIVLERYFRRIRAGTLTNSLCPSDRQWPGLFAEFVRSIGHQEIYNVAMGNGRRNWRIYKNIAY